MRVKYLKYGKSVRTPAGEERAEVSVEVYPGESEYQAMEQAKKFIAESLAAKANPPLTATLGEQIKAKTPQVGSQHFNGA